jgi:hypothetical protein
LNKCEVDEKVGDFINEAFTDYAVTNNIDDIWISGTGIL